jgi:hypothetical protein
VSRKPEFDNLEVGARLRDRWHGQVTVVEVLDCPDVVVAPRRQYRVDVGQGWTTVIWPNDILEVLA